MNNYGYLLVVVPVLSLVITLYAMVVLYKLQSVRVSYEKSTACSLAAPTRFEVGKLYTFDLPESFMLFELKPLSLGDAFAKMNRFGKAAHGDDYSVSSDALAIFSAFDTFGSCHHMPARKRTDVSCSEPWMLLEQQEFLFPDNEVLRAHGVFGLTAAGEVRHRWITSLKVVSKNGQIGWLNLNAVAGDDELTKYIKPFVTARTTDEQ